MGILHSLRPPFLLLALVTVLLAAALAGDFAWLTFALVLIAALAAHGAVNALNEYADFQSGLDQRTARTPFSGGSGYLPAHPAAARQVLCLGLGLLLLCCLLGLYLAWQAGPALLWIGLPGVALVAGYTPWITRNRWLSLVAPGVGFGLLMLCGAERVLGGQYSTAGWLTGLMLALLVNNLLLLNQLPDCEADRSVGRDNIPLRYGLAVSRRVYALQWLLALGCYVLALLQSSVPMLALLALPGFALGLHAWLTVSTNLHAALRSNVLQTLLVPALMALGIGLG